MFGITLPHKPNNYKKIDETVSRSAQPVKSGIKWLKKHGVTDVINFRYSTAKELGFDEKALVEQNGMRYHNIPTDAEHPSERKIGQFLDLVEGIKERGGKVHIHCMAGADRTGMYSWIYKQKHGLGDMDENRQEMIKMGHDNIRYFGLIDWITNYLYKGWQ